MNVLSSIEELVFQILVVLANRNETSGTDLGLDFLKKFNFCTNRLQVHAQISLFLSIVYKAIKNRSIVTKRSIYYENPRIFLKQAVIDRLLTRTCEYLRINRLDLNTIATSKSIAYGDVWLRGEKDIVFSFKTSREGVSLPSLFLDVNDIMCCANFIIVIEKDATFQTIMMSEFYAEYQPCVLITSKGYPDLATRSFLCKLYQKYPKIPIFALVDADPHGFGIYLTYKYGSHNPALKSASGTVLGIPSLKLLGLLPSDTSMLQVKNQDLLQITKSDKLVLQSIKERSYYKEEKKLQFEIEYMEATQRKAEIQCLEKLGPRFLCSEYLPRKLHQEVSTNCLT